MTTLAVDESRCIFLSLSNDWPWFEDLNGVASARVEKIDTNHKIVNKFKLNSTELDILLWTARGKSHAETGEIIGMMQRSISMSLSRIYTKIGVNNAAGAVGFCFCHGILKAQDGRIVINIPE